MYIITLRPRQNGRHIADDIFNCIFLNENVWILIKISLKFVPKDPMNNIPALVQIMAWRRPGDKPLSAPMMVNLLTHICVTRPQWVIPHNNKNAYLVEMWSKYVGNTLVPNIANFKIPAVRNNLRLLPVVSYNMFTGVSIHQPPNNNLSYETNIQDLDLRGVDSRSSHGVWK